MRQFMSCTKAVVILGVGIVASTAYADVDLEWRPAVTEADQGELIELGLYATPSDGAPEPFTVADVILKWDRNFLRYVRLVNTGPYSWMFTGFPADAVLDGWNVSLDDGDAWLSLWARPLDFPVAVDGGLLIATFEFEVLASSGSSSIELIAQGEFATLSAVYDDVVGGLDILDQAGNARVTSGPTQTLGDMDGDGDLDLDDANGLIITCLRGPGTSSDPSTCSVFDFNFDGYVDMADLAEFQNAFTAE